MAPVLIEVPKDHENYRSGTWIISYSLAVETDQVIVATQFQESWRHRTTCPKVRAVYKIINTAASLNRYETYLYGCLCLISGVASIC